MSWLRTRDVRDAQVTTAKIANLAVTAAKIAVGAIDGSKLGVGAVQTANLSQNVLQQITVNLTNTEMLALRATPKVLVPTQGAGKVIEFVSCLYSTLPSGGAYTETADNMAVRYTGTTGAIASGVIETTGVIDGTVQAYSHANAIPCIPVVNSALVLHNTGDGEFGGGNAANVNKIVVTYRVVTLP